MFSSGTCAKDILTIQRDEDLSIPADLAFSEIQGLSNELRLKLERSRPTSIAQASRIEGMTPAALLLLLSRIKQFERARSA